MLLRGAPPLSAPSAATATHRLRAGQLAPPPPGLDACRSIPRPAQGTVASAPCPAPLLAEPPSLATTITMAAQPPLSRPPPAPTPPAAADGLIPTAIVIKNIPFTLPQDGLVAVIARLALPMPYAFNYHLDQGVFRGLAFANFHTPDDAEKVVAALNGFDVAGRKLRAEYKRVLRHGEKERIEKVKAIKRMQSLQFEKEQHRSRRAYFQPPPSPLSPPLVGTGPDLNMNDPTTLDMYSRILLFRDDRMQDELTFSASLSATERCVVHLLAQRLGLQHYSLGDGAERRVVVSKAVSRFQVRPRAPSKEKPHGADPAVSAGPHAPRALLDTEPVVVCAAGLLAFPRRHEHIWHPAAGARCTRAAPRCPRRVAVRPSRASLRPHGREDQLTV